MSSLDQSMAVTVGVREDLAEPGTPECRAAYAHAIAAFNLHGHSFGFTREMVEALEEMMVDARQMHADNCGNATEHAAASAVATLADKAVENLFALLPPEE